MKYTIILLFIFSSCKPMNHLEKFNQYLEKNNNCIEKEMGKKYSELREKQPDDLVALLTRDTIFMMSMFDVQTGTYYESIWDVSKKIFFCYKYLNGTLQKNLDKSIFESYYYDLAEQNDNDKAIMMQKKYKRLLGGNKIYSAKINLINQEPVEINCISFYEFYIPAAPPASAIRAEEED